MRKFITKILLIGIILFWFSSINQTNASDLDELNSLLNVEEKLNCVNISMKINHDYPNYGRKINHLIYTLSKKEQKVKMSYYSKIKSLTNKYLLKLDKNSQKKLYTIVGYLKCENEKYLNIYKKGNFELFDDWIEIRSNFNWKLTNYYFYLDNKLILEDSFFWGTPKTFPYEIINSLDLKNPALYINYNGKVKKSWFYGNWYTKALLRGEKWTFIKYIWGWVEARQNKLYTYFYYNWKLINTVKNKIKNDKYLIFWDNYNWNWWDKYLTSYYAKKKLNLYYATFEEANDRIFFVKEIDGWQINFAYDLEEWKMEDWTFEN